ncbi:MAG: hypothetical protein Q7R56_02760 [Nanoarchaeota archaeon]|nr:hypothetical protein [Nanoarchaeota archaeon]
MKKKLSITIEKSAIVEFEKLLADGSFRNKSHVVEFAVTKFMKEKETK